MTSLRVATSGETLDCSRRRVLAAGGLAALGSLAGCLTAVAGRITNVAAAPAVAMSAGSMGFAHVEDSHTEESSRALEQEEHRIDPVPGRVRTGGRRLSGELQIEGWQTSSTAKANDYNSVRSNKRRSSRWDPDSDRRRRLDRYLDDGVIGGRFAVCLPDAQVPGGGPAIGDELTPRRLFDYLFGRAQSCSADGETLWCWGSNRAELGATLREDDEKRRRVAALSTDEGVCVTGVPGDDDAGSEMLALSARGRASPKLARARPISDADLDGWGDEVAVDDAVVSPTFVCPALATPADGDAELPALLWLTRCLHNDEFLYTGGWLLDDGALYEESCTVLSGEAVMAVAGFATADADTAGDRRREIMGRKLRRRRERTEQGSVIFSGELDRDGFSHLPTVFGSDDGRRQVGTFALTSAIGSGGGSGGGRVSVSDFSVRAEHNGDTAPIHCVATAVDCPVAHLTEDGLTADQKLAAVDMFLTIERIDGEDR